MRRFTMKCLSITIACLCISMGSIAPKEFTDAKNSKAARAGVCCVLSNNLIGSSSTVKKHKIAKSKSSSIENLVDKKLLAKDKNGNITVCGYKNLGIVEVEDGNLNIRKTPEKDGVIVGKITNNSGCEVLKVKEDWVKISSGKVKGWVSSEYLVTGEKALKKANKAASRIATVKTDNLRVRAKASTDARIITKVAEGEKFEVLKVEEDWIKVDLNGDSGYISKEYADVAYELKEGATLKQLQSGNGVSDVRTSLVQYALQFVGGRYVWGGTSLGHGVDCSGFTMGIYARFGIGLPHHSGSQAGCGTRISASDAKPGDLFFYGNGRSIGHVAIYIGNGQIVHAANSRAGIIIGNAFYRHPTCVVRLLP